MTNHSPADLIVTGPPPARTRISEHTLEFRKMKCLKRATEETPCYEADLWVDGALFAQLSNAGHGGPDRVHMMNGKTDADWLAIEAWVAVSYPRIDMSEFGMEDLETNLEMIAHGEAFNKMGM